MSAEKWFIAGPTIIRLDEIKKVKVEKIYDGIKHSIKITVNDEEFIVPIDDDSVVRNWNTEIVSKETAMFFIHANKNDKSVMTLDELIERIIMALK